MKLIGFGHRTSATYAVVELPRFRGVTARLSTYARSRTPRDSQVTAKGANPIRTTFATVTNSSYFAGTVALLNSLRLMGNAEELVVLDQGLQPKERSHLETHVNLIAERDLRGSMGGGDQQIFLAKPFPALLDIDGVVVFIDSDMIATASLEGIVERARSGYVCAFPDPASDRFFGEWAEIFSLKAPLRSQSYVNAGLVAFSTDHWPDLLQRWWDCCMQIKSPPSRGSPTQHLDQDALNAILMSEVDEDRLWIGHPDETPGFDLLLRTRLESRSSLQCSCRGSKTLVLHHAGAGKPWHADGWKHLRRNPYVELLPRTLFHRDVLVHIGPEYVPAWLRAGPRAGVQRLFLGIANRVKSLLVLPIWRRVPKHRRVAVKRVLTLALPHRARSRAGA